MKTFEDFLMDKYIREENPLDDMIPDGFNDWVSQLDPDEFIEYGEQYGKKLLNK